MLHFKKALLISLIPLSSVMASSNLTCPSVSEIKRGDFHTWQVLYRSNQEGAMPNDIEKFKHYVDGFAAAEWSNRFLESGHCFYQGTDSIMHAIILAHAAWHPVTNHTWQWIKPNAAAICLSPDVTNCQFIQ